MNALMIIANPSASSFSHAMAAAGREVLLSRRATVVCHDLYAEGLNPVQPVGEAGNTESGDPLVERHCADLVAADLIAVFHPNW